MEHPRHNFLWAVAVYVTAGVGLVLAVPLGWSLATVVLVWLRLPGRPEALQALERVQEIYGQDRTTWGWTAESPGQQATVEALRPVLRDLDWMAVALIASLVVYPLAGYLCGRFSGRPDWAGALPLLGLATRANPVTMPLELLGVPGGLSLGEQVVVVVVQVVAVHLAAEQGARRR